MLFTCCGNGTPFSMSTDKDNVIVCSNPQVVNCSNECSSVFRVEKLDGCCATFRVLTTNPDTTSVYPFVSTNSFFTINLNCVCIIRCLNDTFVDTI